MKMSEHRSVDPKDVNTTNDNMAVSLDAFITSLVKTFGLPLPTTTKPKHLKNSDVLSARIEQMSIDLINHICLDDKEHVMAVAKLLNFLNNLVLISNKFFNFDKDQSFFIYQEFERDVLIKILHDGLHLIKNSKPTTENGFIDCLCSTLSLDYISNAKSNTTVWLKEQRDKISHGKGSLFKRKITQHQPDKSVERLNKIDEMCEFIENEINAFNKQGYEKFPVISEFKSFWYASVVAQNLQERFNLTQSKNDNLTHLADECFLLFETKFHNSNTDNPYRVDLSLTDFEKIFSRTVLSIMKKHSERKKLLADVDKFNELISLTQQNKITEAFRLSESIIKSNITLIDGGISDIINKLYICLFIKKHPNKAIKPNQFSSIVKNAMLQGSSGFVLPRQNNDAFNQVVSSIFSCSDSLYTLSAIQTFSEIIDESEHLNETEKMECMFPIPEKIEIFLRVLYSFSDHIDMIEIPLSELSQRVRKTTKIMDDKNYISYILESNLYSCLAEINTLMSFWPEKMIIKNEYIKKFCSESITTKRKILLAISPSNYQEDAKTNEK